MKKEVRKVNTGHSIETNTYKVEMVEKLTLDGLTVSYDLSGDTKLHEGHYKNGKKDGLWVEWSFDGKESTWGHYKNGKQDGLWKTWDPDGVLTIEENFIDGEKHGVRSVWIKGKLFRKEHWDKDYGGMKSFERFDGEDIKRYEREQGKLKLQRKEQARVNK
jgi:antitoxin component YwqK of YwqJK toxin-antitoxin module